MGMIMKLKNLICQTQAETNRTLEKRIEVYYDECVQRGFPDKQ